MTRIEKHWNRELLKKWMGIVFVSLILQSFFQAIRELKLLSDTYQISSFLQHLSFESFVFTLEFLPITLFLAAMNLQDEWKKKDYYLNALLDGVTLHKWRSLSLRNAIVLLCAWVPIWFIVLPSHYYMHTLTRLTMIKREPKLNPDKIYMIDNNKLAYIESAENASKILDLQTSTVHHLQEYEQIVSDWKKRFIDFKLGVDKLPIKEKWAYLLTSNGKERSLIISSFMKDGMYLFSLILCWVYISVDREYKMFSTKRDEQNPRWTKRILQISILYWGTKIMPLLARFFNPIGLMAGYISAVFFSFLF